MTASARPCTFPLRTLTMAAKLTSLATDPVKQFSVFAENRVGRLYDLCGLLKTHNVHIMALTTLDRPTAPSSASSWTTPTRPAS